MKEFYIDNDRLDQILSNFFQIIMDPCGKCFWKGEYNHLFRKTLNFLADEQLGTKTASQ